MGPLRIDSLAAEADRVPTERPESDGTLAWDRTEVVLMRVAADAAAFKV